MSPQMHTGTVHRAQHSHIQPNQTPQRWMALRDDTMAPSPPNLLRHGEEKNSDLCGNLGSGVGESIVKGHDIFGLKEIVVGL